MEKNDLNELLSLFKSSDMRNDDFSRKIYLYLCDRMIFFHIESQSYYIFDMSIMDISRCITDYLNKHFFKNFDKYDFIRDIYRREIGPFSDTPVFTTIGDDFLITRNTSDDIRYIHSIIRENKLKKLLK